MKRNNIILLLFSMTIFLLAVEAISRVAVLFYNRNALTFQYGFNSSILVRFKDKEITFVNTSSIDKKRTELDNKSISAGNITLGAFGGSTTHGFNCGKASSSWPEELARTLNNDSNTEITVLNFSANGSNSDYAVEALPFSNPDKLSYALWANFVNASDIILTGPKRNFEVLNNKFGDLLKNRDKKYSINRYGIFLVRLDKTIKKYSLSYMILYNIMLRLKLRLFPLNGTIRGDVTAEKKLIPVALENCRLNFLEAKGFFDAHQIKMILIRLPLQEKMFRQMLEKKNSAFSFSVISCFWEKLDELMVNLSNQYGVPLINVHEQYIKNNTAHDLFCDGAHQQREGHILTAQFIAKKLKPFF